MKELTLSFLWFQATASRYALPGSSSKACTINGIKSTMLIHLVVVVIVFHVFPYIFGDSFYRIMTATFITCSKI